MRIIISVKVTNPVSKRRWHGMSDKDVNEYRDSLEIFAYDYLLNIEKKLNIFYILD